MPATPEGVAKSKKKSAEARKAEADGFIDIEQCGVALRIPVGKKVPLEAAWAFMDGDERGGTRLLLGEEQWSALMNAKPTVGDFEEIGQKLNDVLGN